MGHIYWELKEIPLPEGAHINQNDGRVFIFMDDCKNVRDSKRKTIGRATSSTTMHPNWAPMAGIACAVLAVVTGLPVYYFWESRNKKVTT